MNRLDPYGVMREWSAQERAAGQSRQRHVLKELTVFYVSPTSVSTLYCICYTSTPFPLLHHHLATLIMHDTPRAIQGCNAVERCIIAYQAQCDCQIGGKGKSGPGLGRRENLRGWEESGWMGMGIVDGRDVCLLCILHFIYT